MTVTAARGLFISMSEMDYRVIRSKRRTMALQISREGEILVRAPLHTPQAMIERFVSTHESWIESHQQRRQERQAAHPEPTPAEVEALRRRAKEILPDKLAHYAALMGVTPTGLHITSARTRFGSCSGKNSISFSLYLMQYPEEAIDYVVVHELAHIRHHNHSAAFYAEVAKIMPDYQARQKLLRN